MYYGIEEKMEAPVVPFRLYPNTAASFRRWCRKNGFTADEGLKELMARAGKGGS